MDKMLVNVPLDDWKAYLRWHLVNQSAPYCLENSLTRTLLSFAGH